MDNPQGTARIPLPADVQKAVNAANEKVGVLKEEEIELKRDNAALKKENARLELHGEKLTASIADLEKKEAEAKAAYDNTTTNLDTMIDTFITTKRNVDLAVKELEAAKERTNEESKKLSVIVEQSRAQTAENLAEKQKLTSEVEAFEARKARLQAALASF